MKSSMKEIMAREFKLASQNSVLLTLAGGTQEELKVSYVTLFHDQLISFKRSGLGSWFVKHIKGLCEKLVAVARFFKIISPTNSGYCCN